MVRKIFNFFSKKITGLHEAAYLLGLFAFLSQLAGLVRDRLLAHTFGAGPTLDVYYAAFRIPDLMFVSIASIVSMFVLIPILSDKIQESREDAQRFLSNITSAFFFFIICASIIIFFIIPWFSRVLYPGFSEAQYQDLILMTRILLASPILLGLSNILASATQIFKKFFVYALAPILYNIGIILGILIFYPLWGLKGLVFGVALGALFHVCIQIPAVFKEGLLPIFKINIAWKEVWNIVLVSIPRTITLALSHIVSLILVSMASVMPEGSITIFSFASNLQAAPLSIIGVSYSVAAFPTLAQLFSRGETEQFHQQMVNAIKHILFWSFPAIILVIVLRAQIVRTILGSGAFDWNATRLTAAALALFIISLVANSLMLLFVRGYYAAGKTRKPLIINMISSVLTILLAYGGIVLYKTAPGLQHFFESLLRVQNSTGSGILVLPAAYSIGMIFNALIFWFLYRRDFGGHLPRTLYITIVHSLSASLVAGAIAYIFLSILAPVFNLNTLMGIFMQGAIAGIAGIACGILTLKALRNQELEEIWEAVLGRFWRTKPIAAPEAQEL